MNVGGDTQRPRYALGVPSTWQVTALSSITALGVASGRPVEAALVGGAGGVLAVQLDRRATLRPGALVAMAVLCAVAGAVRSDQSWRGLRPDELGHHRGWVLVVDDPQPYRSSTRVIIEVDGERFETWTRGRARQQRVRTWRGGQRVFVDGERVALDADRARRVAWQHVVGEFVVEWVSDVDEGSGVARASNRVRAAIERAADRLPAADGALFRGLVVGDDRDQPPEMIDRFRASGLSHLTAVSGQNVAFVLAACGPLLRLLGPWWRWAVTIGVVAWFVSLTRFEPSIVRAGVMAGLSASAYVAGRERSPVRLLGWAVIGLVLVDPLLVWSVGFWLSVGATLGVSSVGPWLGDRLPGPEWWRFSVGVTLGAQLGVVVPAVLVFGRLPLVSVPANLLAVPVAGAVMLYGLPAGLLAGWVGGAAPWFADLVMVPCRVGTRWVDTVASLGARAEPEPPVQWIGWPVVAAIVAALVVRSRRGIEAERGSHPGR